MKSLPSMFLLWLSVSALAAEPWSDAARRALEAPEDSSALLALASALGRAPGSEEEAAAGFRELLKISRLEGDLERELSTLVLSRPVRAGWRDLYLRLAAASDNADDALAMKLHAASASLSGGDTKTAVAELSAMLKARPDSDMVALNLAHAQLIAGDVKSAESTLRGRLGSTEAREALILTTLPEAIDDSEAWWRERLKATSWADDRIDALLAPVASDSAARKSAILRDAFLQGPATSEATAHIAFPNGDIVLLRQAALSGSRLERAKALLSYGYTSLTIAVLKEAAPSGPAATEIAENQAMLGRLLLGRGDATGALAAYEAGLNVVPDDVALIVGKSEALAAIGKHTDALQTLGARDANLTARITAAQAFATARATPTTADDLPALQAAWQADGTNIGLARQLGVALDAAGRKADALEPLRVAATGRPRDAAIAALYVNAAVTQGEAAKAIEVARRSLQQILVDADRQRLTGSLQYSWVKRAEELRLAGQVDAMTDAWGIAHLIKPADLGILRAVGGAWWGAGRLEDAWNVYIDVFHANPKDPEGLDALAGLAVQLGRDAEFRSMIEPYADDANVRKVLRELEMRRDLADAEKALRREDVPDAYSRYLRLQARDPGNPEVLRGLASVKLAEGDKEGALALFKQARAADMDNPWSLLGEANALMAVGELEAAEALLDEVTGTTDVGLAQEIERARTRLTLSRGQALMEADEDEQAFQLFATALKTQPDTWVCHNIATLYARHRQYDLAAAFYEEAFFYDGSNIYPRLGTASLYIELGQLEKAESLLDTLPPADPDVAAARRSLEVARAVREADIARRVGETDDARKLIQAVYEKYPDDPAARGAWENEILDDEDPEQVLIAARSFLIEDPLDERALGAALNAAHKLRKTESVLPLFESAAAKGGPRHLAWLNRARIAASTDKAMTLHKEGRHDDAVRMLEALADRAGADVPSWDILGGAWLEIGETRRAIETFDRALALNPSDASALIGKAGTFATMGRIREGIDLLELAWNERRDPEIGIALAELYQSRRQLKEVDRVLDELDALGPLRPEVDPLPVLELPSKRAVEHLEPADAPSVLAPSMEVRRRELRENSPGGKWLPGFDLGAGIYSRPGVAGEQFLTAFFVPVRLHELRAGPVAFDIEAVPYFLSDAEDEEYGAQVSAGLQTGVGPVGIHLRGGASPLGFSSRPYFIWHGSVGVNASEQVALGVLTTREPVTDSLTSWAGKLARNGEIYGRVHRTSIGGYITVNPTPADKLSLFGRGGWNEGLQMESRVAFWEAVISGSHNFSWNLFDMRLGGLVLGMSYSDQLDLFKPGHGGFFAPELFVMGAGGIEGRVHTRDDRFRACAGTQLGAQFIQADNTRGKDDYIQPGVFFGYSLAAAIDWRMARYWWLGVDYGRTVTGTTWRQDIAMLHLHFGPNDAWQRAKSTVYSPLAGQPVLQAQTCGN